MAEKKRDEIGELLDKQGNVLWKRSADISSNDERLPEFPYPFRRPDRLRNAFVKAARIATAELAQHLKAG